MVETPHEITEEVSQNILKGITIPPQPQLVVDIQMEMASPNTSLNRVAAIITKDMGLSGSILKVVNSPFFGLRNKITSIQQALSLLGIKNVVNIVNSLSLRSALSHHSIIEMTKVWDSSMDIAIAASIISKQLKIASADEAYSLGLFHNCGIPLLMAKFPNYLAVLKQGYDEPEHFITDIENEHLGCNHAVIGYYVARAWKLPDHMCTVIADHHKSEAIFTEKLPCITPAKNLLAILKLAEHCCHTYQSFSHAKIDYEFERQKHDLFLYLGLSEYDFQDLIAEVAEIGHAS